MQNLQEVISSHCEFVVAVWQSFLSLHISQQLLESGDVKGVWRCCSNYFDVLFETDSCGRESKCGLVVRSQMHPQCVLGVSTPSFRSVHFHSTHVDTKCEQPLTACKSL